MYVICTGVVYLKRLQTHSLCLQVNFSSRSVESELGWSFQLCWARLGLIYFFNISSMWGRDDSQGKVAPRKWEELSTVEVLQLAPSAVSRKHSRVSSARPVRCWLMLTQRTKSRPKSGDASQRMTRSWVVSFNTAGSIAVLVVKRFLGCGSPEWEILPEMIYDGNEDFIVEMKALLYESGMKEFYSEMAACLVQLAWLEDT